MRINVNGVSLFFDTEGSKLVPDGAELRERPTLVAVHGGPGSDHAMYRPHLSPLSRIAQVVYLDLRGNGRSDQSTPDHWNLTTWADDVREFCDILHIERPVVLGTSFGGFVAQAYATRYPDHPGKLILCSTNARFDLGRTLAMFDRLGGADEVAAARRFFAEPTADAIQNYIDLCLPLYTRLEVKNPGPSSIRQLNVARHFVGGEWHTFDFRADLERISCPTLVLAGAHDVILPIEGSEEMVTCLPPDLVRFMRFPECGHNVLREQPEEALAVIEEFIYPSAP